MIKVARRLGGALGALALVAGAASGALHLHGAAAQPATQPAGFSCAGAFSVSIYNAASRSSSLDQEPSGPRPEFAMQGRATLLADATGSVEGAIELPDGTRAGLVGQVTGRAVNLVVTRADGTQVYGVGTARNNVAACRGEMGGPATDEQPGRVGSWLFTADNS